jgi:hypothetical protein
MYSITIVMISTAMCTFLTNEISPAITQPHLPVRNKKIISTYRLIISDQVVCQCF